MARRASSRRDPGRLVYAGTNDGVERGGRARHRRPSLHSGLAAGGVLGAGGPRQRAGDGEGTSQRAGSERLWRRGSDQPDSHRRRLDTGRSAADPRRPGDDLLSGLLVLGGDGRTSRLHEISIMIRDSDNGAAEDIYQVNGSTASINRLISICGLTDSRATSGSWSKTYLSSRDAVRMGKCIADGRAAGGKWTSWLLTEMRNVR